MTRYVARARSLFKFEFHIDVEDREVAWVRHRAFRAGGDAELNGIPAEIARMAMGEWTLSRGEPPLARIRRTGAMRVNHELSWPGGAVEMRTPFFGFRTDLVASGEVVGRIAQVSLMTRTLVVDAPDFVPMAAVALAVWHTVRRRRRAAGAAAGGG